MKLVTEIQHALDKNEEPLCIFLTKQTSTAINSWSPQATVLSFILFTVYINGILLIETNTTIHPSNTKA